MSEPASVAGLVLVNGRGGQSSNFCSGVAITGTLVVTHVRCAVLDVEVDAGLVAQDAGPFECDSRTGSPVEDSRFLAWTQPVLGRGAIQVTWRRPDASAVMVGVDQVFTPRSASYCSDQLAVLKLDTALDVEKVPLRLYDDSRLEEPVTLSGFGTGPTSRREFATTIESITFGAGDDTIPPHSLLLRRQACAYDLGAAVSSPETGALIGIVISSFGAGCGDPEGKTIALRLAPFQRLLQEAADDARVTLAAEIGTKTPSGTPIPPCAP